MRSWSLGEAQPVQCWVSGAAWSLPPLLWAVTKFETSQLMWMCSAMALNQVATCWHNRIWSRLIVHGLIQLLWKVVQPLQSCHDC